MVLGRDRECLTNQLDSVVSLNIEYDDGRPNDFESLDSRLILTRLFYTDFEGKSHIFMSHLFFRFIKNGQKWKLRRANIFLHLIYFLIITRDHHRTCGQQWMGKLWLCSRRFEIHSFVIFSYAGAKGGDDEYVLYDEIMCSELFVIFISSLYFTLCVTLS